MKRYNCVCTSIMLEKEDGPYVRIDDIPSLIEALQMQYKKLSDKLEDAHCLIAVMEESP